MFIKEIEPAELEEWLREYAPLKLIDVRTPQEMAQASIANADALPLVALPLRFSEVPDNEKVVFYCRTGARSGQACMFMEQHGYKNVYNLRGGIVSWARHGLPVEPMLMQ
ncbi:rhodanese-like domain-containing protein [Candidatus Albibeggiatoa sp. nov. BB20]|uniref:rhodanese-like domain-containing protein n=1 Tax=Candidatus Albibeggiatoa sp. nov. BB20 TaxID=3162723 RepID=UPI0033653B42